MKNKNVIDELDQISPWLKDFKQQGDGLKIPEGYFEDFESELFSRLEASGDLGRQPMKVVKRPGLFALFIRPKAAMAYAAALAMILAAVWFIRQDTSAVQEVTFVSTELTEDDIESYVLENVQEFDPEQLAALTPEETFHPSEKSAPPATKKNNAAFDEIHPDDLEKILDEMTDEELEQIL